MGPRGADSLARARVSRLGYGWLFLCSSGDFYYPAVVRRGALQIAISTAGESPALAQRLRKKLEKQFGPEYTAWVKRLGSARRKLQATSEDTGEKKSSAHTMASEHSFRTFQRDLGQGSRGKGPLKRAK